MLDAGCWNKVYSFEKLLGNREWAKLSQIGAFAAAD
jgi:hypothetical protein